jgi:3-oxoadipate enol-lactonase
MNMIPYKENNNDTCHGESGYINLGKSKLYYEIFGEGEPVVLIHAGVTDSRMWAFQINDLSRHFKVIRYDMRGYGKSSLPDSIYDPNVDLSTLLDACGLPKANLVGISLGAMQAIDFTINYPDRVISLAISGPGMPDWPMSPERLSKYLEFNRIVEEKGADGAIFTLLNDPFWSRTIPGERYPEARELFENILYENKKSFGVNWQLRKFTPGLKERLSEIKCPTLLFRPEHDGPLMVSISIAIQEKIDGIKIREVKDAYHLLNMEKPEEFNQAIIEFINYVYK